MSFWLMKTDRDAMQIMRIAMAKAVWVFWERLLEYNSLERVRKFTGEPR